MEQEELMRALRKLLVFGILFEGIGLVRFEVLLSIFAVCLTIVMCAHFVSARHVNSA